MKKKKTNKPQTDDMLPEYDLEGKKGVRGKYAKSLQKEYSVRVLKEDGTVETRQFVPKENAVVLDPDVKVYFPDSESVNNALRSLINIIPEERLNQIAENQGKYDKK
jgi:hypothetical protein